MSFSINWKAIADPDFTSSLLLSINEFFAETFPIPPISSLKLLSLSWPDLVHNEPTIELLSIADPHPLFSVASNVKPHVRSGSRPDSGSGSSPFEWTTGPFPNASQGLDDVQVELKFDYHGPVTVEWELELISPAVLPALPAGLCSLPTRVSISDLSISCTLVLAYTQATHSWYLAVKGDSGSSDSDFYFQMKATSQIGGTLNLGSKVEQLLSEGLVKFVREQLTFPNYFQLLCEPVSSQV